MIIQALHDVLNSSIDDIQADMDPCTHTPMYKTIDEHMSMENEVIDLAEIILTLVDFSSHHGVSGTDMEAVRTSFNFLYHKKSYYQELIKRDDEKIERLNKLVDEAKNIIIESGRRSVEVCGLFTN